MITYKEMRLLADEVRRQMCAQSRRWDMPNQMLNGGEELKSNETFWMNYQTKGADAPNIPAKKGAILQRAVIYQGELHWLLKLAIDRAKEEDEVLWNVASQDVAREYTIKKIKSLRHWREAILNKRSL
jgi:hypothetical protein